MKTKVKTILAIMVVAIFANTNLATAQNMSRWVELNVQQGETINFWLASNVSNTPVRVISGSTDTIVKVFSFGTQATCYADSNIMRLYGNIKQINCGGNESKITGVDVSNNTMLTVLNCNNNSLTSIDVSGLTSFEALYCSNNSLTSIDVSGLPSLWLLDCSNNSLTSLDVGGLTSLWTLDCSNNSLTSLDVSGLTTLIELYCYDNNLSSLNFDETMLLNELDCSSNSLTSLDVSGLTLLLTLRYNNNSITSLDYSGFTRLETLCCDNNGITSLDASSLTSLETLCCNNNSLTSLDVSNSRFLTHLECANNELTLLNTKALAGIRKLYCNNNLLTSLDVSKFISLNCLVCYGNNFTTQALDQIYCDLPKMYCKGRAVTPCYGRIFPIYDESSPDYSKVVATNKQNARRKSWLVQYACDSSDVYTTGTYQCETSTSLEDISQTTIYPNPVNDILYINTDSRITSIEIYDIYGRLVLNKTQLAATKSNVDVSFLTNGVYVLRLGTTKGTTELKFIKQ
ncbi:MAG: leucine-rich repeat domain-containing protein [Lentimicrobiaceae bacterium]|nr:leucine-rich repeat domain-containing protein [Lentimicrobiaceae bacterium]